MEEVHGVDVSWLHTPNRENQGTRQRATSGTSSASKKDGNPAGSGNGNGNSTSKPANGRSSPPQQTDAKMNPDPSTSPDQTKLPSPANVTPATPAPPTKDSSNAHPSTPSPHANGKAAPQQKRPGLLNRASAEKLNGEGKASSRRASWVNSISSKFSSSPHPERPSPTPTQTSKSPTNSSTSTPPAANAQHGGGEATEKVEPYIPSKPKEGTSFFSNLTRRLSSASQAGGIPKAQGTGGVCPRRVLNIDPNRERCLVPEMDPNKLRKVSFCVDVEIAGGPRYTSDDDEGDKKRKQSQNRMKERAEGEALKRPEGLKEEKDEQGEPALEAESKAKAVPVPRKEEGEKDGLDEDGDVVAGSLEDDKEKGPAAISRKKEKKKKSEEERKERKEKRRKRAEENGTIPVELSLDGEGEDASLGTGTPALEKHGSRPESVSNAPLQLQPNAGKQDRPTTDPARIYRRCCQLRESPILKRITEQLMSPKCTLPQESGVVNCLDLTGSRLQLADVVAVGDWLAVVPVKHLKLEDADLNDEGVRCILAGLLATKRPEPTKRKSTVPKHREGIKYPPHQERTGIVEKLTLKNNPRISRNGWKHISLFIYLCRSLKAIDVSMNQFPESLPACTTPVKSPGRSPEGPPSAGHDLEAAEALGKCLSERLGGAKLEEFILSECGLAAPQIRKIVDGCIVSGVSRLGLAGNALDAAGLEHVIHYLRSGVCHALDVGGNDLRGSLGALAAALDTRREGGLPCWGLSFAGCNLDSASLKPLFPALVRMPDFRFIDLSHNPDLCSSDDALIALLRRYTGRLANLKRIHLTDVGMSPKQAISLADVLPEGPRLAHVNLLENRQLTALAEAKTEDQQEEACALYASLMAAVRCSSTLICVDIDVPGPDNSEVVKALAKQVVAYSLRNMEAMTMAEATGKAVPPTENATDHLTGPHGGKKGLKEVSVPDVLMHLVGRADGDADHSGDEIDPAPDGDYIVGGTGVVKALQYVLGEKDSPGRRTSIPSTPTGSNTPRTQSRSGSITPAGAMEQKGKAKEMSKNLLGSARQIRGRLQPALAKEAALGDEMAYRRLLFLDGTLESMIRRFEQEYPETRLPGAKTHGSEEEGGGIAKGKLLPSSPPRRNTADAVDATADSVPAADAGKDPSLSDEDDFHDADDDADADPRPAVRRHNSDVSLASRALAIEEGRLHRIGQRLRRDVIDSPRAGSPARPATANAGASGADAGATQLAAGTEKRGASGGAPSQTGSTTTAAQTLTAPAADSSHADDPASTASDSESARIAVVASHIESLSGSELKGIIDREGWEAVLGKVGGNLEDLRAMHEQDGEAWRLFAESQRAARWNAGGYGG